MLKCFTRNISEEIDMSVFYKRKIENCWSFVGKSELFLNEALLHINHNNRVALYWSDLGNTGCMYL